MKHHRLRLLLAALFCALPLAAADKPNIILVITDDQGYPPVGKHGHPWLRTPHLDSLHQQSTRFTRFLVNPTCSPTRSALMTGRHALKNGVTHTLYERERMTLKATTLPQVLKSVGYRTGIFGKWHLGDEEAYQPGKRGFDESFIHGAGGIGQAFNCSLADAPNNKYFNPIIRHNGMFKQTEGFCTDVFFTAALDWIAADSEPGKPFFAYISTNAPHGPFIAPKENADRFLSLGFGKSQAGYYGMIENIDTNIGRLMTELENRKLLENSVLIFMSDNGMTGGGSGEPGNPVANGHPFYDAGMKGLKGSADEGGVRVPFFLRWDNHFPTGKDIDRIAGDIDLFPTLAALAGAELPAGQIEGRNLLPLVKESGAAPWPDRYLFTHVGRWPVGAEPNDHQWEKFSVRNQRFRLVGRDQLFDMEKDPGQNTNVASANPIVVEEMLAAYEVFWKETRPLMVNENVPLSKTRPYHEHFHQQKNTMGIPRWMPRQR